MNKIVIITTRGGGGYTPSMIINRPFIFMLRNKNLPVNYEMLFMSKVLKLE